ncbi:hypothetical protein [Candidatus Coxiella mudrowiae]|uniref:hypothetical protein n=1 Tax=Candidatus Coxiella mudrowiae TaxID=2054173 RepID=UPI0012FF28CD|nr:hypothetical protein [Candidatus Coxiella mudrowiae]
MASAHLHLLPILSRQDLACSSLVCSDYVRVTYELYRLLHPIAPIKIIFVGCNGGIIENHVQIFTKYTGIPLLLDPTIGLIAKATFNQVASGHKIPSAEMINFYSRNDINTFFSYRHWKSKHWQI